jgi:exopolysaccharide biosynthesis protein
MAYREVTRTNCEGGTATYNYSVCTPDKVDILWSTTAKKFSQLMASYTGTWIRASNSSYLNTSTGYPLGYIIKNHSILTAAQLEDKRYDGWWLSDQAYNYFVDPGTGDFINLVNVQQCAKGFNVGPILVMGGAKTNLASQISEVPYTGLNQSKATQSGMPILRVGFGWSYNTSRIIHVFCRVGGCSLFDLQDFFMEFPGILSALAFDGGGSAGMIDKEIGAGVIGNDQRLMKTALVMTKVNGLGPLSGEP